MATEKSRNSMNITAEQFQMLLQQQQAQMEAQMKLMETLTQRLSLQSTETASGDTQANSVDLLSNSITEFNYDVDSGCTFDAWFKRWEDMFRVDFNRQNDSWKVRLLLRKLGTNEHSRFVDHILPRQPNELTFDETVSQLREIFSESASLFSIRYQCLKIVKKDADSYGVFADIVNRECERFKLRSLTDDQFKCLIFISALQAPQDAEIRTRLLTKLDQDPETTLKSLTAECKRLLTLKHDTAMVEKNLHEQPRNVHSVINPKRNKPDHTSQMSQKRPPTACWSCGEMHFARFCPFKKHTCQKCHKRGHKEEFCKQPRSMTRKPSRFNKVKNTGADSMSVVATFETDGKPTTSMGQADALSRLIDSHQQEKEDIVIASIESEPDVKFLLRNALQDLPVTAEAVRTETLRDPLLKKVAQYHRTSWPSSYPSTELQQYYQRRQSLSIVDDCILFAERVVIPKSLQERVLRQFHAGHPGITRMKALARSYVYWPHMDKQIEELAQRCQKCANAQKAPRKAELHSWQMPTKPWCRIHADFAGPINGQNFLIVVDAYSKWPEVFLMDSPTTNATISKLRQIFGRFGCPETLVTDNGTQFTSAVFTEFCKSCAMQHLRSPPFHPQSNGQAERFVDSFKRALLKSKGEGRIEETIDRFLFLYRSTPNPQAPNGVSPAEAMMNRKLRMPFDVLRPNPEPSYSGRNKKLEHEFNRRHGAKPRTFKPGDFVRARDYRSGHAAWATGEIQRRHGDVIYDVLIGSQTWVRHANQLRPTSCQAERTGQAELPFDLLVDQFNLLKPELDNETKQNEATDRPETHRKEFEHRRWTDRRRIPSTRLQVNPRLPSYTAASISRGEMLGRHGNFSGKCINTIEERKEPITNNRRSKKFQEDSAEGPPD